MAFGVEPGLPGFLRWAPPNTRVCDLGDADEPLWDASRQRCHVIAGSACPNVNKSSGGYLLKVQTTPSIHSENHRSIESLPESPLVQGARAMRRAASRCKSRFIP